MEYQIPNYLDIAKSKGELYFGDVLLSFNDFMKTIILRMFTFFQLISWRIY